MPVEVLVWAYVAAVLAGCAWIAVAWSLHGERSS